MCLLFLRICDRLWYLGCCRSPCDKETSAVWVYSVQPAYNTGINNLSLTSWQEKWLDSSGIAWNQVTQSHTRNRALRFPADSTGMTQNYQKIGVFNPQKRPICSAAIGTTKWQVPDQHPHARCLFAAEMCKNSGSGIPPIFFCGKPMVNLWLIYG